MMTSALLQLLEEGPGTSAELGAELGVCLHSCSANLHRLWCEGRIDRNTVRVKQARRGIPAYLYGVVGAFAAPADRPPPRAKRVRVYTKRVRAYRYRDRRKYRALRKLRDKEKSPSSNAL